MYEQRTERSRSAEPLQRIKSLRLRSVYYVYGFDRISVSLSAIYTTCLLRKFQKKSSLTLGFVTFPITFRGKDSTTIMV
jgi:hypothetical protein